MESETNISLDKKMCLTIEETAKYSNIGIGKLRELAKNPRNRFTLTIGSKTLIKRKEFEEFISGVSEI